MATDGTNDTRTVIHGITDLIRSQGLTTGDRLPSIRQLSTSLGVGPNVVRDALLQAQTMGLVRVHPRSGAFVQSVDFSSLVDALEEMVETALRQEDGNMFHLIEARRLIEIELVGKACGRRTPEDMLPLRMALETMMTHVADRTAFIEADEKLHIGIAKIAGNPVLTSILRALIVLLRPHRLGLLPTSDRRLRTESWHEEIYRAVRDGDADAARAAMGEHLREDRNRVLAQMDTMPSSLNNWDGHGNDTETDVSATSEQEV